MSLKMVDNIMQSFVVQSCIAMTRRMVIVRLQVEQTMLCANSARRNVLDR